MGHRTAANVITAAHDQDRGTGSPLPGSASADRPAVGPQQPVPGVVRPGGIRELPCQHPQAQVRGRRDGHAETAERIVGVHQEFDAGAADVVGRARRTGDVVGPGLVCSRVAVSGPMPQRYLEAGTQLGLPVLSGPHLIFGRLSRQNRSSEVLPEAGTLLRVPG